MKLTLFIFKYLYAMAGVACLYIAYWSLFNEEAFDFIAMAAFSLYFLSMSWHMRIK